MEGKTVAGKGSLEVPDYFEMLRIECKFDIDEVELQQSYRRLMAQLHPDRHSRSTEPEQRAAAARSAEITHAHATLKAAHSRAMHLLALHGAPLTEDSSEGLLAPDFLMEASATAPCQSTSFVTNWAHVCVLFFSPSGPVHAREESLRTHGHVAAPDELMMHRCWRLESSSKRRAMHLLALHGAPLTEDSSEGLLAPDFLMEVLEAREQLEASVHGKTLQMLRQQNDVRTDNLCKGLAAAFNEGRLGEARSLTAQLQYLHRIHDEITVRSDVS
eukprot:CAMPEP_0119398882 /NCGR_PEP_ID=MMETSP1334-20130426/141073_1 /TAXON_ID=127549 /ORGANISM="Calcidiscus leptoporus, Strain RCC1130" /LENGTH=272 /DNA_ID=CAMNT_0007422761 /DNA_START=148 /DNA_END=966 /DNA_ORIENTATION=-